MTDFELNKLNTILNYYKGNLVYTSFLLEKAYLQNGPASKDITNKEFIDTAKIGFITNILLSIKEYIVENIGNLNFESKLLTNSLEKTVENVATKTDKGYIIDNTLIGNAAEVVALLRNKLAHGNFYIDLKHSKIILNVKNKEIKLSISKLTNFIVYALNDYYKNRTEIEHKETLLTTTNIQTDRKKPISNKKELERFLKSFKKLEITLSKKDSKPIEGRILSILNYAISEYKRTNNIKYLRIFETEVEKEGYNFSYEFVKIENIDYEKVAENLLIMIPKDVDYKEEIDYVSKHFGKLLNTNHKFEGLSSSMNNLIILDSIDKNNSINIEKYVEEVYGGLQITYSEAVMGTIAMFNSLFSYSLDDLYENKNAYTSKPLDGLDYSKLDLSLLNIELYTIDDKYINGVKLELASKQKKLSELTNSLNKTKMQINTNQKNGNTKVVNLMNNKLATLNGYISRINGEIQDLNEKITYFNNNTTYIKNLAIINGIRNSIAHGDYKVSLDETFETCKIYFENIYEGKTTFKASIGLKDFIFLMNNNHDLIIDFIYDRLKENAKISNESANLTPKP